MYAGCISGISDGDCLGMLMVYPVLLSMDFFVLLEVLWALE